MTCGMEGLQISRGDRVRIGGKLWRVREVLPGDFGALLLARPLGQAVSHLLRFDDDTAFALDHAATDRRVDEALVWTWNEVGELRRV